MFSIPTAALSPDWWSDPASPAAIDGEAGNLPDQSDANVGVVTRRTFPSITEHEAAPDVSDIALPERLSQLPGSCAATQRHGVGAP